MPGCWASATGSALNTPARLPNRASKVRAMGLVSLRGMAVISRYSMTS